MSADRWHVVTEIFHGALARDGDARAVYLADACKGDRSLRLDVDALLAAHRDAGSFGDATGGVADVTPRLKTGNRLGPYRIDALSGAGGMGEVYRATDTRLGRTVAVKILPAHLRTSPDRKARFDREAHIISQLTHPHICTLHDVGQENGIDFLVMEYLEGETLADRVSRGPLRLDETLGIAIEIADAIDHAHRHDVVHRDLKPANVMLTASGVKLLDFGIAKLLSPDDRSAETRRHRTATGTLVGTPQYMAPEQRAGRPADARSDLWALGATIYEMMTGRTAVEGALQSLAPSTMNGLVRQCLAERPEDRPHTAQDVATELRWIRETGSDSAHGRVQPSRRRGAGIGLAIVAGLVLIAAGAAVTWPLDRRVSRGPVTRVSVDLQPAEELQAGSVDVFMPTPGGARTSFTWTPDGEALIFVGQAGGVRQLYVRRLDAVTARPLPNTVRAASPTVSPDGRWVAFFVGRTFKKVALADGAVMDLASTESTEPPVGLVWDAHDRLFFGNGSNGGIWQIPSGGGAAAPVTKPAQGEITHVLPWPLPGGRVLLYTVRKRNWSWGDETVVAQTLSTGTRKVLLTDAADARYVPTGHLVFLRRGELFAVPFDAARVEVTGKEVPLLESVAQSLMSANTVAITGAGQFAVAPTGTLAWVPGVVEAFPDRAIVWVDRTGRISPLPAPIRSYATALRISPDGGRLAVAIRTPTEVGLWLYDLARGTLTLLNGGGEESDTPVWSPNGRQLVFCWVAKGVPALGMQPADGTAPPRALATGHLLAPASFTPDGRQLAVVGGIYKIATIPLDDRQTPVRPLIDSADIQGWPEFSPAGGWLAYASDVSGKRQIYVRPYPDPGPTVQVSINGGGNPAWRRDGRELFFVEDGPPGSNVARLMAVDFAAGSTPKIGRPAVLFEFNGRDEVMFGCVPTRCYDVAADGKRFYAMQNRTPFPHPIVTHINLITNWFQELKGKVPAGY
jgi:serine/threonine-protein kinase